MALLQECPQCKKRLPMKGRDASDGRKTTKALEVCPTCGFKLEKAAGKGLLDRILYRRKEEAEEDRAEQESCRASH